MNVEKLKSELVSQKKSDFNGNIYQFSQVKFSFNSNKIEGSTITEEQTEEIFDTASFISKTEEVIKLDDIMEAKNHFKLFDYMLDNIDNNISKEMLLEMNVILKKNTTDEENPGFNIGGFKVIPNIIGVVNTVKTSSPKNVEKDIDDLLEEYNGIEKVKLEDIIDFHVKFERIHPFADGNGRVGRIIMFKECLKNNIMPFIILNDKRTYYMRGLKEYDNDRNYLIDTCLDAQDIYEDVCLQLLDYKA